MRFENNSEKLLLINFIAFLRCSYIWNDIQRLLKLCIHFNHFKFISSFTSLQYVYVILWLICQSNLHNKIQENQSRSISSFSFSVRVIFVLFLTFITCQWISKLMISVDRFFPANSFVVLVGTKQSFIIKFLRYSWHDFWTDQMSS